MTKEELTMQIAISGAALAVGFLGLLLGYWVFIRPYFLQFREQLQHEAWMRRQYLMASDKERAQQREAYAKDWDGFGHPASWLTDLVVQDSLREIENWTPRNRPRDGTDKKYICAADVTLPWLLHPSELSAAHASFVSVKPYPFSSPSIVSQVIVLISDTEKLFDQDFYGFPVQFPRRYPIYGSRPLYAFSTKFSHYRR